VPYQTRFLCVYVRLFAPFSFASLTQYQYLQNARIPRNSGICTAYPKGKRFPGFLETLSITEGASCYVLILVSFLTSNSSLFRLFHCVYRWVPQSDRLNVSMRTKEITLPRVRMPHLTGCLLNGPPTLGDGEQRNHGHTYWIHHKNQESSFVHCVANFWSLLLEMYAVLFVLFYFLG